jgi:alpha-tubulin suppressor-like RCC1 family protein
LHFSSLAGGASNHCGVTDSGTLMCWGRGDEGQLFNGHQDSSVPVEIIPE